MATEYAFFHPSDSAQVFSASYYKIDLDCKHAYQSLIHHKMINSQLFINSLETFRN